MNIRIIAFIAVLQLEPIASFSNCKLDSYKSISNQQRNAEQISRAMSTFPTQWLSFNFSDTESTVFDLMDAGPYTTTTSSLKSKRTNNATETETETETETNGSSTTASSGPDLLKQQENGSSVGIGGKDGLVYDVNKLKRNRVQEILRDYKEELLTLEIENTPSQNQNQNNNDNSRGETSSNNRDIQQKFQSLDEKMLALLQINPVSTTTDSNLLDGQWTFAYASEEAARYVDASFSISTKKKVQNKSIPSKRLSSRSSNYMRKQLYSSSSSSSSSSNKKKKKKKKHLVGEPWKFKQNKEGFFRTSTRDVHLEDLQDYEDPYIIDRTRFLGGVATFEIRYDVKNLTRKTMQIHPMEYNVYFFKKWKWIRTPKMGEGQIQVLYLDSDICMCRPLDDDNEVVGPLLLYTKSKIWVSGKERARRRLRLLRTVPSFLKSKIQGVKEKKKPPPSSSSTIKIGEFPALSNEPSWSVDDDPFAHLPLEERIETMKGMSIQEIEEAGQRQREKSKKQRERKYRKPKKFKRPEYW